MAERPPIPPALVAELTEAVPKRIVRKLDKKPELAESWDWSAAGVGTDKGETVSWSLEDGTVSTLSCTCLLAPRCLHVLAVATRPLIASHSCARALRDHPRQWAARAEAALALGRVEQALEDAEQALALVESTGNVDGRDHALHVRRLAQERLGR